MSTHINFYSVDLDRFYRIVGSKDEDLVEHITAIAQSHLIHYHSLDDFSWEICRKIIRQLIFEGSIPQQIKNQSLIDLGVPEDELPDEEIAFELEQVIMASLNIVDDDKEYTSMRYSECVEVWREISTQTTLSEEQMELWNFLLRRRALINEELAWHGYLTKAELDAFLKSLEPLVDLPQNPEIEEPFFKEADSKNHLYLSRIQAHRSKKYQRSSVITENYRNHRLNLLYRLLARIDRDLFYTVH